MPAVLRDYQQACHDAVLAAWGESPWKDKEADTFRSVLVNMATSAGKTVTTGAIIESVVQRGRCLFVADTDELTLQPQKVFSRLFRMQAALEKAESRASMMAQVVVGSAQTLCRDNRLTRFHPNHFSYVFVDEAHRGSDRNKKITDYFSGAKVMGMTATAFRARLADLSDYYDHVAFELGVFDLINEGYVAPLKVLTLPVNVDISQVHQKSGDYDANELDTTIAPYYEEICRLVLEHATNRQIICYLPLIKSSKEFVVIARGMGIDARHVDGDSPDRRQIVESFERKKFQLLSNSSLLTTGWDCPSCDCLLNLAPTRSAGLFRQKVGRIGRVLPGTIDGITDKDARLAAIAGSAKPDALILDLLWQTERFGLQGPSDLIATNIRQRDDIDRALRGLRIATDLQVVTAEVQERYEQRLKKALLRKQQTAEVKAGLEAISTVALLLQGRKVLEYEAVMKWEHQPVTDKQRDWMVKNGFDPETAADRGHVSKLMSLIFARREAGLCPPGVVKELELAGITQGATRMSADKAFELLGGSYPVGFGNKYFKRPLCSVPWSTWEFWEKSNNEDGPHQGWMERSYPIEWRYMQKILHPEGECACIGSHRAPNCPVHPRKDESIFEALP